MYKHVSLSLENTINDNQSLRTCIDESAEDSTDDLTKIVSGQTQTYVNAPVLWERTSTGYRIVDLRVYHISQAMDLIISHFFHEEPICHATSLSDDAPSMKSYRQFVISNLLQGNGFCAIREGTGKLVGVAVMPICQKTNPDNQDIHQGPALSFAMTLKKNLLVETELENKLHDLEEYFRIDVLCVDPDHRGKGVATGLLRSCVAKTRFLNVPICIGVFSSDTSRRIANRLGFEKLGEIPYATYITEDEKHNPFKNMGTGNYSLVCMAIRPFLETALTLEQSPTSTSVSKKSKKR